MIITQPTNKEVIPYGTVKLDGCSETKIGFDFLSEQPSVGRRRYCNKVLVHECVTVPEISPLDLDYIEFLATDDPCYTFFNLYKSSQAIGETAPTIELQYDEYLVIGLIITFTKEETGCLPLRMTYRINGYDQDGVKMKLAQGNLYVTPCGNSESVKSIWVDTEW